MVFFRQWRSGKFTGSLSLAILVLLLAALIVGCAPAASSKPAAPPAAAPIVIGFPVADDNYLHF